MFSITIAASLRSGPCPSFSDNDRGSRDEEQPRAVAARVEAPLRRRRRRRHVVREADGEAAREQSREPQEPLLQSGRGRRAARAAAARGVIGTGGEEAVPAQEKGEVGREGKGERRETHCTRLSKKDDCSIHNIPSQ